jgi:hypothetical protein
MWPADAALLAVLVGIVAIAYLAVGVALQRWREESALKHAPAVYEAGGDAADVLRAVAPKHEWSLPWHRWPRG